MYPVPTGPLPTNWLSEGGQLRSPVWKDCWGGVAWATAGAFWDP